MDSQAGIIEIDLSAQNTQDGSAVKTNFQQAMGLGFVALKAKFYDELGADLTNISIQRRFSVPSVIYDFDETTALQTTTDQVIFYSSYIGKPLGGSVTVSPRYCCTCSFQNKCSFNILWRCIWRSCKQYICNYYPSSANTL